ncbi:MAG: site-specific DNA-methyltransferase [Candidatus Bathyarchaeota archaeon]|nr:site-specific DNA-methyltransferase [Candidatus Bathyarchaeota archaeon]
MGKLPDESVNLVMTSPPYWGLRDYGVQGQFGLEQTWQEYVANLVKVGKEVLRILKKDGSFYLNLGDTFQDKRKLGIPWRVRFALNEIGWISRADIVWHKPNAMPASVKDRLSCTYEMIFHFVKSKKYYFDLDAIREPHKTKPAKAPTAKFSAWHKKTRYRGKFCKAPDPEKFGSPRARLLRTYRNVPVSPPHRSSYGEWAMMHRSLMYHPKGKNPGDLFAIHTRPSGIEHFAVYPEALCIKPMLSSSRPGDIVFDPFAGGGTTAVVAKRLERRFLGCDISSKYVRFAKRRLTAYRK